MTAYVFGYGSLVNCSTHSYSDTRLARISGWRRAWRHVEGRQVAFLTAVPARNSEISGVIASVPDKDWGALDEREFSYDRTPTQDVIYPGPSIPDIQIYHAPPEKHQSASIKRPILLSYLDVVVQGYFREFGSSGVAEFFASTDGWDAPILNDRDAPKYRRHLKTSPEERKLTEHLLAEFGGTIDTQFSPN